MSNFTDVASVEKTDIASGRIARGFAGAFDILHEGPNSPTGGRKNRPCRAIVAFGAVEYTGIDGVNVILGDPGGTYEWPIQAIAIVSGDGVVIW